MLKMKAAVNKAKNDKIAAKRHAEINYKLKKQKKDLKAAKKVSSLRSLEAKEAAKEKTKLTQVLAKSSD